MPEYKVTFTGYGANRSMYRGRQVYIQTTHNWDTNDNEAANVLFIARKEVKKHFSRFAITSIEKQG